MFLILNNFLTTSIEKAYGHDRSNRFHTTYSCYRMAPTTRPKPQNPSTVFCWISVAVVTISLVVKVVNGARKECENPLTKVRNCSWTHMLGGGALNNPIGRNLKKAWRYNWWLTSKCALQHPTIFLLVEFGKLLMELYALKLAIGSWQRLAPLPSSWLINQATSLSRHLVIQVYDISYKMTTIWKASWGLLQY